MMESNGSAPVAVIPAAGLGQRLMPVSSAIPKAMVPLAGQPLISLTINQLARLGVRRFVIAIGRHGEQLRSYVERTYDGSSLEFAFVEQRELDGPLGAARLAQPLAGDGPQLIYLGDTLCRDALTFDRDFVLAHPVDDQWRWCMAEAGPDGTLRRLLDKPAERTSEAALALIGVYYFADGARWRDCIEDVYRAGERLHGEFQLSSAIARYNRTRPIEVRRAEDWSDCGSIDRYVTARRQMIQSRHLNTVWVDDLGVLHKQSNGSDHLANEIRWYLCIPDSVKPLTPRVFSYSLAPESTRIALEYIPVPTLAEIYLYANVHAEVWEYALHRVLDLWARVFLAAPARSGDNAAHAMAMYWQKTEERLAEAGDVLPSGGSIALNGRALASWQDVRLRVRDALERISASGRWSLIHGDPHFGNLLFDFNSGQLKMIDPRGAFGEVGCYGDARYDLAKLLHSFHGGYAHLAAGMFELRETAEGYDLRLYGGSDRAHLLDFFRRWLARTEIDFDELVLIEGLLFLSLVPLHADDRQRQTAAYLTGLSLVSDALERMEHVASVR